MSLWSSLETGSIRKRLQASIVLLALVPFVVLLVSLQQLQSMSGDAQRIALAGSLRMSAFIVAAQLNSHLANPQTYKLEIVEEELERMEQTLEALQYGDPETGLGPTESAELIARIEEAQHALDLYWSDATNARQLAESGTLDRQRLEEASLDVLGSAYGFLALSNLATRDLTEHAQASVFRLQVFQWSAVALALLITVMTILGVRRYVLRPIPRFLAAFADVSEQRYGVHVHVPGNNEFSRLATAFNGMSDALEGAYHSLVAKQTEILEKNTELERASKLKSQFVSNVSHELRTPLSAVIGYSQLLKRGVYGDVPKPVLEALHGIEESTRGLAALVNDILDLARIDAGRAEIHTESLTLSDVVREAGEVLRPLTVAKGLELRIDAPEDLPVITSDRDKIRRILVNLGANAVKFTREGSVTLRAKPAPRGRVELSVEDTGIGIDASDTETIFEDFVQLEESHTREFAGTGLGLPISRRLARRLGGDIRVESRLGRGSVFTLELPIEAQCEQPSVAPSENGRKAADTGGGQRIAEPGTSTSPVSAPDDSEEVGHDSE